MKTKKQKVLDEKSITIDCRSEEGITIGLIDSLISIARVLSKRNLEESRGVKEALQDLRSDEDIEFLVFNPHERTAIKSAIQIIKDNQLPLRL